MRHPSVKDEANDIDECREGDDVARLVLLCADWLGRLPQWDQCAASAHGLTATLVATHLVVPRVHRRLPWMPLDTAVLASHEEELVRGVLPQLRGQVAARLPGLLSLIDGGMRQAREAFDDVSAAELAGKLLETVESFESAGEGISELELSAVLSTYLHNRSPSRGAPLSTLGRPRGSVLPSSEVPGRQPAAKRGWRLVEIPVGTLAPVSRTRSGEIAIGWPRPTTAATLTVELVGCRLEVDLCNPSQLPVCYVSDPGRGAGTVASVFGDDAAGAVLRAAAEPEAVLACPVVAGPAMAGLVNLACLRWCRATSPLPLDDALLEAQELCFVGRLRGVLAESSGWAEDLSRLCGQLIDARQPDVVVDRLLVDAMELLMATES